jgi:RNA polymerase sigma-70 factor (ECF subfamily)
VRSRVGDGTGLGVAVRARVGDGTGLGVAVCTREGDGTGAGADVRVGMDDGDGHGLAVRARVGDGTGTGADVRVLVGDGTGAGARVPVGDGTGVAVRCRVGTGDGQAARAWTTAGAWITAAGVATAACARAAPPAPSAATGSAVHATTRRRVTFMEPPQIEEPVSGREVQQRYVYRPDRLLVPWLRRVSGRAARIGPLRQTAESGGWLSLEEFTEFYNASFRRLVGQLYAMTGDHAEAQDSVQEAFIRAWEHRRKLDRDGAPEAWVRLTAWRIAMSRWRRARSGLRLLSAQPAPPAVAGPDPGRVALMAALRQVPAEQRRVLVLYHLCDLTIEQIAAETGTSAGTVKSRLARGRANLAGLLHDGSGQEVPSA